MRQAGYRRLTGHSTITAVKMTAVKTGVPCGVALPDLATRHGAGECAGEADGAGRTRGGEQQHRLLAGERRPVVLVHARRAGS